jgi:hypothetical protein
VNAWHEEVSWKGNPIKHSQNHQESQYYARQNASAFLFVKLVLVIIIRLDHAYLSVHNALNQNQTP